jgi:colanic acid/amylovoran biosynthesis protein
MKLSADSVTVLLINVHSNCNAGDAALLEMSIRIARQTFISPRIIVAANWPEEPQYKKYGVKVVGSAFYITGSSKKSTYLRIITQTLLGISTGWLVTHHILKPESKLIPSNWRNLFRAYAESDCVMAVPGNQFGSTGTWGWPFPLTTLAVEFCYWFNKPFYVLPQSIGPLRRKWEERMLRSVYRRARLIFLRDNGSLELAKQLNLPIQKTFYMPDPAFLLTPGDRDQAIKLLNTYGYNESENCIGVTVVSRLGHSLNQSDVTQYYHDLGTSIGNILMMENVHIYFFNQVTGPTNLEDDRNANDAVRSCLEGESSRISVITQELPPSQLKACYGLMDLFIASRLHSGIFAMSMGVPTVFFGYLSKTRGLLQALGLDYWVVDLGEKDHEMLSKKIIEGWEKRKDLSIQIQSLLPDINLKLQSLPVLLRDDYEKAKWS